MTPGAGEHTAEPPTPAPAPSSPDAGPAGLLHVALTVDQCWAPVPGGTAVAAVELIAALGDRGVRCTGVAAWHGGPPREPLPAGLAVRRAPLPTLALTEAWHRLGRPRVERLVAGADVVHATGGAVPATRRPLVVTVHDLDWRHDPGRYTARGRHFFRRAFDLTRRHADIVICPSHHTAADAADAGIDHDRLRVIPHGCRLAPASDDAVAAARARHRLERPYVLTVGTVEPRKNLPRLLDAFGRLARNDLDLVLVGPAGWKEDLSDRLAGDERVKALGYLPGSDVAALMAGAEVFAYPSLREGFGLPVLEAMGQGTPVVTSSGTSTEEVAGDAAILVDPHDTDDIADGLRRALDPHAAAELGPAGRARAATFTWARAAEQTEDAYRAARA